MFGRAEQSDLFSFTCFCQVDSTLSGFDFQANCSAGPIQAGKPDHDVNAGPVTALRIRPSRLQGGQAVPATQWMPGLYRVVIEGNFILGAKEVEVPDPVQPDKLIKVFPALDGNHFGPGLQRGRCPTGDAIEGGRFLSWFEIT